MSIGNPTGANQHKRNPADLRDSSSDTDTKQPTITTRQAAEMVNVGQRTVESANRVIKKGSSELQKAVESGDVKVSTAATIAVLPEEEQYELVTQGKEAVAAAAKAYGLNSVFPQHAFRNKSKLFQSDCATLKAMVDYLSARIRP